MLLNFCISDMNKRNKGRELVGAEHLHLIYSVERQVFKAAIFYSSRN